MISISSSDEAPPEALLRIATFRFSAEPQRCQGCEPERAPEGLGLYRFEVSVLQKRLDGITDGTRHKRQSLSFQIPYGNKRP